MNAEVTPYRFMDYKKIYLPSIICYGIFIFAIIKLVAIISLEPFFGFANNYDFFRQSSCIGLWLNVSQNIHQPQANPVVPLLINDGYINLNNFQFSIDTVIPYLVTKIYTINQVIPIKIIGAIRVVCLIGFTSWLLWGCGLDNRARRYVALWFGLIFADFANILYFNTLYLEISVLMGLFLSTSCLIYLSLARKINSSLFLLTLVSIALLGLSKEQYLFLAIIFAIYLTCLIATKEPKKIWAPLLIAVLIPTIYYYLNNPKKEGVLQLNNISNKVNTFLGAVLPEASDPFKALITLRLPESCISGIGLNWHSPDYWKSLPCQEVAKVNRLRLLPLFIKQPTTLVNPPLKTIKYIYPFKSNLQFSTISNVEDSYLYRFLEAISISTLLTKAGKVFYFLTSLALMSIFFILLPVMLINLIRNKSISTTISACFIGSLIMNYTIFSTVYGDGYVEPFKHAIGFLVGYIFSASGCFTIILHQIRNRLPKWYRSSNNTY